MQLYMYQIMTIDSKRQTPFKPIHLERGGPIKHNSSLLLRDGPVSLAQISWVSEELVDCSRTQGQRGIEEEDNRQRQQA